jgi:glycosyltransferase involved in cell wall biosynthesis
MDKIRVLVGSPIYQKPGILAVFLASLKNLAHRITLDFLFVDDNVDAESSQMLAAFAREGAEVLVWRGEEKGEYLCDEVSHAWNVGLMLKVANYKNSIIKYAIKNDYDFLFLVDSDLVLHPNLIEHLITLDKDIVSEIFWSQWHEGEPCLPNVWLFDEYDLVPRTPGEELTDQEKQIRQTRFLQQLRTPGVYEVGGLGACTLISRQALLTSVNFAPVKNLTIWGEDRYFCIRAAVLGLALFVDTHYPAYHIYRERDLAGVAAYVRQNVAEACFARTYREQGNRITLSMIVKDEENRYLPRVLACLRGHVDEAVIIDDGSTDKTVKICRELLPDIPLHIITNKESLFANESALRQQQWQETIKYNPDWILNLDADELPEESFWEAVPALLNDPEFDLYGLRLYDMWNETHYREEQYWNAHSIYRPFLLRYQPAFPYRWQEGLQHCGRFPVNIFSLKKADITLRIQHLGWMTAADRAAKYQRYQALDPDAIYGIKEQYDSILDITPNLIKWE